MPTAPRSPTASPEPQGPLAAEPVRPRPSQTRSVAQLATGRAATIAVLAASTPVLSRLYVDGSSWAIYGIICAIVMCLQPVCYGLCYCQAMPLATTTAERRDLFVLSLVIGTAAVALMTVLALVAGQEIADRCGKPDLGPYLFFVPLTCLCTVAGGATTMALNCQRQFKLVALRTGLMGVARAIVQITCGLASATCSALGLLLGNLAASYVNSVPYSAATVRSLWRHSESPLRLAGLMETARRFKSFPRFRFWTETLMQVADNFPMLFLGFLFLDEVGKAYVMAKSVLVIPVRLFTATSRDVFYVEAAERIQEGDATGSAASELLELLTLMTAFPLVVLFVLGPLVFEIALGANWHEAGVYAQILVPWIAVYILAQPLSAIFDATSRLGEGLAYNVLLLLLQAGAMGLGWAVAGPRTVLVLYSTITVVVWAVILARVLQLAGVGRRRVARALLISYGEAFVLLVPAGAFYWWGDMKIAAMAALALATVAYAVIIDRRRPEIRRKVLRRRGAGS